jgi:hypothetical protein
MSIKDVVDKQDGCYWKRTLTEVPSCCALANLFVNSLSCVIFALCLESWYSFNSFAFLLSVANEREEKIGLCTLVIT